MAHAPTTDFENTIILQVVRSKILTIGHLVVVRPQGLLFGRDRHIEEKEQRLRLKEVDVSRTHAGIYWKDGAWILEDFESKFGVFATIDTRHERFQRLDDNSMQIKLRHDQQIRIASTIFKVHYHATCDSCRLSSNPIYSTTKPTAIEEVKNEEKEKKISSKKPRLRPVSLKVAPPTVSDVLKVPELKVSTPVSRLQKPISPKNKGSLLLRSMGWKPGESLGKKEDAHIIEPIVPVVVVGRRGLGMGNGISNLNVRKK